MVNNTYKTCRHTDYIRNDNKIISAFVLNDVHITFVSQHGPICSNLISVAPKTTLLLINTAPLQKSQQLMLVDPMESEQAFLRPRRPILKSARSSHDYVYPCTPSSKRKLHSSNMISGTPKTTLFLINTAPLLHRTGLPK